MKCHQILSYGMKSRKEKCLSFFFALVHMAGTLDELPKIRYWTPINTGACQMKKNNN